MVCGVPGEFPVLEDDGLLRLIEHRHQLEVRGELAIDVPDGAFELPSLRRVRSAEEAHPPMLA